MISFNIRNGLHSIVLERGQELCLVSLNTAFAEGRLRLAEASDVLSHISPCRKAAEIDAFGYDRPIK